MLENDDGPEIERRSGRERRKENKELEDALAEVQRLHGAATTLATAVANTAHRSELVSLRETINKDFRQKLIYQAVLAVVAIIILISFFNHKMNNHARAVDKRFQVTNCLQGKTEAQRTGELGITSLAACRATVR